MGIILHPGAGTVEARRFPAIGSLSWLVCPSKFVVMRFFCYIRTSAVSPVPAHWLLPSQECFVGLKRATKRANPAGCKLLGKVINATWNGHYNLSGKLKGIPPSREPKILLLLEYLIFQLCATLVTCQNICSLVCASVSQPLTKLDAQNFPGKREIRISCILRVVLGQLGHYGSAWGHPGYTWI